MKFILHEDDTQIDNAKLINNLDSKFEALLDKCENPVDVDTVQAELNSIYTQTANDNIKVDAAKTNIQKYLGILVNTFGVSNIKNNNAIAEKYATLNNFLKYEADNTDKDDIATKNAVAELGILNSSLGTATQNFLDQIKNELEESKEIIESKKKEINNTDTSTETLTAFDNIIPSIDEIKNLDVDSIIEIANKLDKLEFVQKKAKATDDWKELINTASTDKDTLEQVWENYYQAEWPNDIDAIKKLSPYFQQDCLELGFISANNPFIAFLKQNNNILKQIDRDHYAVLHNMYARQALTKKDLLTDETPVAKLIRNDVFYKKPILELWSSDSNKLVYGWIPSIVNRSFKDNKLTFEDEKLAQAYRADPAKFTIQLLFGNILNTTHLPNNTTTKLNSLADIEATLINCGYNNTASITANEIKATDLDGIITRIPTNLRKQAIIYLTTKFVNSETQPSIDKLINKQEVQTVLNDVSLTMGDMKQLNKLFMNKTIGSSQLVMLITKLISTITSTQ